MAQPLYSYRMNHLGQSPFSWHSQTFLEGLQRIKHIINLNTKAINWKVKASEIWKIRRPTGFLDTFFPLCSAVGISNFSYFSSIAQYQGRTSGYQFEVKYIKRGWSLLHKWLETENWISYSSTGMAPSAPPSCGIVVMLNHLYLTLSSALVKGIKLLFIKPTKARIFLWSHIPAQAATWWWDLEGAGVCAWVLLRMLELNKILVSLVVLQHVLSPCIANSGCLWNTAEVFSPSSTRDFMCYI